MKKKKKRKTRWRENSAGDYLWRDVSRRFGGKGGFWPRFHADPAFEPRPTVHRWINRGAESANSRAERSCYYHREIRYGAPLPLSSLCLLSIILEMASIIIISCTGIEDVKSFKFDRRLV